MESGAELPTPRRDWALFLDIDGTLLDIARTPDAVVVPAELRDHLIAIQRIFGGAVALVSGRSIAAIDGLFALPHLPAAGQHGAERRLGEEHEFVPPHPCLRAIAAELKLFAAAHPGILVEDKGRSIAIHYRALPELETEVRTQAEHAVAGAAGELELMPARMALDIKPRTSSKGSAIGWFMSRAPFANRVPVFVGDDRTDEDGFAAVNERGGVSIRVGTGRDTMAHFCIASPSVLREWVASIKRCGEEGGPLIAGTLR